MPIHQNPELGELKLEDYLPEYSEAVSRLILKFLEHSKGQNADPNDLGLVFKSTANNSVIDPIVNRLFDEHPELEDDRQEIDRKWWDNFSDEEKKKYEGNKEFLEIRKHASRFRVVLASPFSNEVHLAEARHHLKNTDTLHRSVVMNHAEALGYLAVWSGASTLYLDEHMQIDAKVVDPELSIEDQRLVVSKFEPVLYDLSLP